MSRNAKVSIGIVAAVALVATLVWALIPDGGDSSTASQPAAVTAPAPGEAASIAARTDSRTLSRGSTPVTFVEFLDFECEACGALYPVVEQLRADYGDRVTFVVRYFPLPNHDNAEPAARAVEAAAQQDRFEQMYSTMFERQAQWGDKPTRADDVFRGYARELGLDLAAWDAAYDSPATLEKVREDVADGTSLGVTSTPTFFLDGTRLQPKTVQDIRAALDAALVKQGGGA
ncbi:thioredoxin domain-containing protein [Pseudonocardia sp. N23]|uniref:DsbA family protein n=1 Tax=Pseudonocardia sp. N23 TaxID=1987376 RepID=UPI000BFC4734|nr:thioredoxin domain-containing protein [Pseudonocardia sp. N23]GAY12596.1 membrane protein, putative [Pseudonocardia sp. N23]